MMEHKKGERSAGFKSAAQDKLRQDHETAANTAGIQNHMKAAEHFSEASKYHYEAARLHEAGEFEKANTAALLAIGHASLASEYQKIDVQNHVKNEKK